MLVAVLKPIRVLTITAALLGLQVALFVSAATRVQAQVSTLQDRSLDLSSSQPSLANVVHEFIFTYTSSNSVGSLAFQYCSNDPFPNTACTAPAGLDTSAATLDHQAGEIGFSVHANTTANRIVIGRGAAIPVVPPQVSEYEFSNITNPSTIGSYYIRLTTYNSLDGTGPSLDAAGMAFSINDTFAISTTVPPFLLFCSSITIPGNSCAGASGQKISFGSFNTANTSTATSQLLVATNATSGVNITVSGTTLTSGNFSIPRMESPLFALTGTSQFGINLRDNSLPDVGSEPSGPGVISPTADYNNLNRFKFQPNQVIASSTTATDTKKFTVSYIVNISDSQQAGQYSTTLGYIALASF